ncbi:MAG: toprim domain-containing protein [Candidatus Odinarchaeota archaeon]|nr:toprim domain-containing protein [Candidatus Odinarchaeota archaeon]
MKIDKVDEIRNLVLMINQENISIIVEGRNDVLALREIGINTNIYPVKEIVRNNKCSLVEFIEHVSKKSKKFLILTDFDDEGKRIAKKLASLLSQRNVSLQSSLRKRIIRLMKKQSVTIEGFKKVFCY